MKDLSSIHRKKYSISITYKWIFGIKRTKTIFYYQGTLRELLQFSHSSHKGKLQEYIKEYLVENGLPRGVMRKLSSERILEILKTLSDTFAKGYLSEQKSSGTSKKSSPIYSTICAILKETNETLESLLSLTWEQLDFIIRGVAWNANAGTKKGMARNWMNLDKEEWKNEMSDEEALQSIKENLSESK